jgi:hypothetical protein
MTPSLKKLEIVFIIIMILSLIVHFVSSGTKHLKGDGFEYALMSQSFVNHLTPDARLQDIIKLKNNIQQHASFHIDADQIFSGYENMITQKLDYTFGYFKTHDDQFYSFHFWLYPLLNAPSLWLTEQLHVSPIRSFHITNIVIFLITILFLMKNTFLTRKQKYFISAFYLLCGTTYYVSWSHPEIFSGSLLLIGLILLLDKRFLLAASLFALAAQQNPPIGIIAGIALILQFQMSLTLFLKKEITVYQIIRSLGAMMIVGCILLLSPIFYYWHFQTSNLIVKAGGSNLQLISWKRLHSLFFDFNQGIVVASLFTMIVIALLGLLYTFKSNLRHDRAAKRNLLIACLMIILSILLGIPALSAPNWNPGESIFLRYGYWVSMPLGIAAMLFISELSLRRYLLIFITFIVGQSWLVYQHNIIGREDYLNNKPLAIYLYEKYPNLYNPIPNIFFERGEHKEEGIDSQKMYFYVNKESNITKILYRQNYSTAISPCQKKPLNELTHMGNEVTSEQGWTYFNFKKNACPTHLAPGFYSIPIRGANI